MSTICSPGQCQEQYNEAYGPFYSAPVAWCVAGMAQLKTVVVHCGCMLETLEKLFLKKNTNALAHYIRISEDEAMSEAF